MQVRYNGGTMSFSGCSDPTNLVVGNVYNVIDIEDKGWQTNYILEGELGKYNSVWFDKVDSQTDCLLEVKPGRRLYFFGRNPHKTKHNPKTKTDRRTFLAVASTTPVVGNRLPCKRLIRYDDDWSFHSCTTSTVEVVAKIGDNLYQVTTRNSIYMVQVLDA